MSKVCLLGAPLTTTNMGVSALATSFIRIMRQLDNTMDVSLLAGAKEPGFKQIDIGDSIYTVKIVNYRMSPKARLHENLLWILFLSILHRLIPIKSLRNKITNYNPYLNEIEQSIFIGSIHGGDSFSDIYGVSRYIAAILPDLIPILLNKSFVLLPQTYGPYKYRLAQKIARFIIMRASLVLCRDITGVETVKQMIGNAGVNQKILFCPDVAFLLHSDSIQNALSFKHDANAPVIGINVNGLMYKGGYNRSNMFGISVDYGELITGIIHRFLLQSNANIILIPHNIVRRGDIESDLDACEAVIRGIPDSLVSRVRIAGQKNSPSEIKGIISKCDFFIGSRMHSCIAALSLGIPAVGIAYSKKFSGVFGAVGAGELVVDARSVDMQTAMDVVWRHFENRKTWSALLKSTMPGIQNKIIDIFRSATILDARQ